MSYDSIVIFSFPLDIILLGIYTLGIFIIHTYFAQSKVLRLLEGKEIRIGLPILAAIVIVAGSFFNVSYFYSVGFLILLLAMLMAIELSLLNGVCKKADFYLIHMGLWLTLSGFILSVPDRITLGRDPWRIAIIVGFVTMSFGSLMAIPWKKILGKHHVYILTLIALAIAVLILWLQYPNIFSKDRQPVLMSGWFIPHVTAYMVSYALLASALTISVISKWKPFLEQAADMLTRLGAAFFLIGMLLGSLWAMNAWGSGWAWDIKESWAAATYLMYIACIHLKKSFPMQKGWAIALNAIAFAMLTITWLGLQYFPNASNSLHLYN